LNTDPTVNNSQNKCPTETAHKQYFHYLNIAALTEQINFPNTHIATQNKIEDHTIYLFPFDLPHYKIVTNHALPEPTAKLNCLARGFEI